ncbi:MAG: hypothetical protein V3V20_00265 [Algisphaera sp.]
MLHFKKRGAFTRRASATNQTRFFQKAAGAFLFALPTVFTTACVPHDRLHFPATPLHIQSNGALLFDTNNNGHADFAFATSGDSPALNTLAFDDDENGTPDRLFRLNEYADDSVPHLAVLIDSIPFESIAKRYAADTRLSVFNPPVKVIAPYPSMSALCFTSILQAPPMPGPINRFYDPRPQHAQVNNLISHRMKGHRNAWQQRLHYNLNYRDSGVAFIKPLPFMKVEFERARQAFDASPDRDTLVYISSTAAMLFKYGEPGLDMIFDEFNRFVAQVLYERRGAVKISVMSDHGHNLRETRWINIEKHLSQSGFHITQKPRKPNDVFLEQDGLMTWFGVHTAKPDQVADSLLKLPEIETVAYLTGENVTLRTPAGHAVISKHNQQLTYRPVHGNPLSYTQTLCNIPLSPDQWFAATADHHYPDAPARLWQAFHGGTHQTPQVMVTLQDGACAGIGWFQWFVDPQSSHGGLNQINSAAFAMTMTGRLNDKGPLRSREVMGLLLPNGPPRIVSENRE